MGYSGSGRAVGVGSRTRIDRGEARRPLRQVSRKYRTRFARSVWHRCIGLPPLTLAEVGGVLSPVKLWVLAMLTAKRRLRVAAVPPRCGEFDRTCARLPAGWQVGTEEQVLRSNQGTMMAQPL